MLTSLFAAIAIGQPSFQQPWVFKDIGKSYDRFAIYTSDGKLAQPRISPRREWGFDYLSAGYASLFKEPLQWEARFRVYSQERLAKADLAPITVHTLLRLWEFNADKLKVDHAPTYKRIVDVYLASQGKAGGEQMFAPDPYELDKNGSARKANVIYIYHLDTFRGSMEQFREIAHEYGHAALPPVGGFDKPEYWANGELGERLYSLWMLRALRAKQLTKVDTFGTEEPALAKYVADKVTPLRAQAAKYGPTNDYSGKTAACMMNWIGLVLYCSDIMEQPVFARLMLLGGDKAKDWVKTAGDVVSEKPKTVLKNPGPKGSTLWIPTGRSKVTGAKVLRTLNGWSKVIVGSGTITLTTP